MSKGWKQYSAQEVIDAIEDSFGIVSAIAKRLGCTRRTVYNYIDKYVTVEKAWQVERQRHVDLAETKSLELVRSGDGPQVRFVLSRLGKDRGWVEKQELDLTHRVADDELESAIATELARLSGVSKETVLRTAEGDADSTDAEP